MDITKIDSHLSDFEVRKRLQDQAMRHFYLLRPAPKKMAINELDSFRDLVCERFSDTRRPKGRLVCARGWWGGRARNQRDTSRPTKDPRVKHSAGWYDTPTTYLEFGVASGRTMAATAARIRHPDSRFYGFDSFDGLPEDWPVHGPKGGISKGTFARHGNLPAIDDPRVELIKGWFQNTLPPFLGSGKAGGPTPHLVHYDADLYSSTLFILTTLWHHLPDYFFVMHEYMYDEIVALRDFVLSFPVNVTFFAECGDKLFGRLTRVPFTPD